LDPGPEVHAHVEANQTIVTGERRKNFPPCKPMIHHDINTDIPESKRTLVRQNYISWFCKKKKQFIVYSCLFIYLFIYFFFEKTK